MADRSVKVVLKGDISDFNRAMLAASAGAKTFSDGLDTSTDRMTSLVQTSLALGPALVPIGAAAVPAIAGLSNQLAFATAGAGVAVLAFQGVGDALKATNDYGIAPTTAHLDKMNQTLAKLGPAGREFVTFLQDLRPELQGLQDVAQEGLLTGVQSGLTDLTDLMPQALRIVSSIATTMGDLFAEAGDNLNDPHWREFFVFLEREAKPTLTDMGRTLGNFAEGFANLWMAFDPLADDFSHSFLQLSRDFAKWTDGLDQTQGFQEFVAYIRENGPEAFDALQSLGNALVEIVEAAAPVGAALLPVITAVGDGIAKIADSDLGPAIIGIVSLTSALSRLKALSVAANSSSFSGLFGMTAYSGAAKAAKDLPAATAASLRFDAAAARASMSAGQFAEANGRLGRSLRGASGIAAGAGGVALVMSDLDNKMGLTNTATLGLAGSLAGPWGAAIGVGVGLALDFAAANDDVGDALERADAIAKDSSLSISQRITAIDAEIAAMERLQVANEASTVHSAGGQARASSAPEDRVTAEEKALKKLGQTRVQLAEAANEQKFAEAGVTDAMRFASEETRRETAAIIDNIKAKNDAVDAAENAFSAETNYRQALKDARKQAEASNKGIDGSSEAALKNRQALDSLANAWNRVADAGDATGKDMRKARKNFIDVAVGMGVSRKEAELLSRELFHLPSPKVRVSVLGVDGAVEKINHVKDRLLSLDGTTAQTFVQIKESVGKADGGLVRRYDSGGYVSGPGGPREDKIPAMLSNGEFVVNAAATSRNLALLHEINAQKFAGGGVARIQRMADGGSVAVAAAPAQSLDSRVLANQLAAASERGFARALSNARLYVASDGSIRAKSMGA